MIDAEAGITQRLLADAGVAPGMRVLDVGSGWGNVAFMLAAMVGEQGQTPTTSSQTGTIVRAIMPRIAAQGVATEAEIDVDTLDARLDQERRDANATFVGDVTFGAWARRA